MNGIAVIIAVVIGLAVAWMIAGPRWGLTMGALAGGITAVLTLTGNPTYIADCSDFYGGPPVGCQPLSWWTKHGTQSIQITVFVVLVIAVTWLVPLMVKGMKATSAH